VKTIIRSAFNEETINDQFANTTTSLATLQSGIPNHAAAWGHILGSERQERAAGPDIQTTKTMNWCEHFSSSLNVTLCQSDFTGISDWPIN